MYNIDESAIDSIKAALKKLKELPRDLWGKATSAFRSLFDHASGKNKSLSEGVTALFSPTKETGKTADDFMMGATLAFEVTQRNVDSYLAICDITLKHSKTIKSNKTLHAACAAYNDDIAASVKKHNARIASDAQKYNIPNGDNRPSHLAYAAGLMSDKAKKDLIKNHPEYCKALRNLYNAWGTKIVTDLSKVADFLSKGGPATKEIARIQRAVAETDYDEYQKTVVAGLAAIAEDYKYTANDIYSIVDTVSPVLSELEGAVKNENSGVSGPMGFAPSIINEKYTWSAFSITDNPTRINLSLKKATKTLEKSLESASSVDKINDLIDAGDAMRDSFNDQRKRCISLTVSDWMMKDDKLLKDAAENCKKWISWYNNDFRSRALKKKKDLEKTNKLKNESYGVGDPMEYDADVIDEGVSIKNIFKSKPSIKSNTDSAPDECIRGLEIYYSTVNHLQDQLLADALAIKKWLNGITPATVATVEAIHKANLACVDEINENARKLRSAFDRDKTKFNIDKSVKNNLTYGMDLAFGIVKIKDIADSPYCDKIVKLRNSWNKTISSKMWKIVDLIKQSGELDMLYAKKYPIIEDDRVHKLFGTFYVDRINEIADEFKTDRETLLEFDDRYLLPLANAHGASGNTVSDLKDAVKNKIKLISKRSLTESVAPRNIFYRMTESEMFMTANRMAKINGQEVVDILPRVAVEGQGFAHVGINDLDSTVVYELFESNRFKLSCKQQMKKLLAGGDVVLAYGDEYRIPTCIPFVIQSKGRNAATVFVNITPFTSINKNGKIVVTQIRNYSGLMAVVFAGCVAYETIRGGGSLPADLADALVLFYAGMMTKVINGLVHADSIQKETCKYLCAEFALVQMYGTEKGTTIFQRFKNKYFPKLGNLVVNSIDDTFHIDSFDNMTLFVEELKKNYPIMKGLSVPAISERWMRSFGSATALSLDYLGFHLYTLCMLLFESPLVSRMALEPLIDQKLGSNAFKRMQIMIEG